MIILVITDEDFFKPFNETTQNKRNGVKYKTKLVIIVLKAFLLIRI